MKHVKAYILLMILAGMFSSCMDDTLQGTSYNIDSECLAREGEKDMRLKVSVPRTYNSNGGVTLGREERIDTLDVLVFASVAGSTKKYLRAAATGTPVKDEDGNLVNNVFEVIMPLGENMDVHVFANSHYDLVRCGALGAVGTEMEALLGRITQNRKYGLQKTETLLPMHGSVVGITVNKDSKDVLPVSVLRSVAKVSVQLAGTVSADGELSGGELAEFKLRELYTFYPADSGRIATADTTQFYITKPDSGNVKTATLPAKLRAGNRPDSLSIINTTDVKQIESIYLYENIPWTKDGFDYATTRIVVGGIYTDPSTGKVDKDAHGNPRVSYYRINFQDAYDTGTPVQYPVLRNHHYIFKINSVAAPGYDDPRQAAEGKPININVTVIDWKNEIHEVNYDGQSYFELSEKNITLPRYTGSERSIEVESNVDVAEWGMYFEDTQNGVTTPQTWFKDKQNQDSIVATTGNTLQNSRYKVTKAANKITVKVLKKYSELPAGESREDVLILMVKNLRIYINISQEDISQDDWGNGGDMNTDIGEDPNKAIDIGLGFVVAPGNVIKKDGVYTFFESQAGYTHKWDGGDYFNWGVIDPLDIATISDVFVDVCKEVGELWRTPSKEEWKELVDTGWTWTDWITEDGNKVRGMFFGTNAEAVTQENQERHVFLPAVGTRGGNDTSVGSIGGYVKYWSSTNNNATTAFGVDCYSNKPNYNWAGSKQYGLLVRCVRDK